MLLLVVCGALLFAQDGKRSKESNPGPAVPKSDEKDPTQHASTSRGPIDILTDTRGVDFDPYLARVLHSVREHWYRVIPESAREPTMKGGTVVVEFRILKDGTVQDLQYVASSGDGALDGAALAGIASSTPFLPLPREFACQYLALRFHFYYNPKPGDVTDRHPADRQLLPCVTSSIQMVGEVRITVSPSLAEVPSGSQWQFSATITGGTKAPVNWMVSGPGCAASACGSISADGLYTAPTSIPNPPTVTVTAASTGNTSEAGSAAITIVRATPPH